jgi:hypothetical protein
MLGSKAIFLFLESLMGFDPQLEIRRVAQDCCCQLTAKKPVSAQSPLSTFNSQLSTLKLPTPFLPAFDDDFGLREEFDRLMPLPM